MKDNWYEEELQYESKYSAWDFDFDDAKKLKEEHEEKHNRIRQIEDLKREKINADNARIKYEVPNKNIKGLYVIISLVFSLFFGPLFPVAFIITYLSLIKNIKERSKM